MKPGDKEKEREKRQVLFSGPVAWYRENAANTGARAKCFDANAKVEMPTVNQNRDDRPQRTPDVMSENIAHLPGPEEWIYESVHASQGEVLEARLDGVVP